MIHLKCKIDGQRKLPVDNLSVNSLKIIPERLLHLTGSQRIYYGRFQRLTGGPEMWLLIGTFFKNVIVDIFKYDASKKWCWAFAISTSIFHGFLSPLVLALFRMALSLRWVLKKQNNINSFEGL